LRLDAKPILQEERSLTAALGAIAGDNLLSGDHKVKDVSAFGVAAEAVEFAGLSVDGKRRRLIIMEGAAKPELNAVLAGFSCVASMRP